MALPSQGGFSSVRGSNMYRRRRRKRRPMSWVLLLVAAAVTIYFIWPDKDNQESLNTTNIEDGSHFVTIPVTEEEPIVANNEIPEDILITKEESVNPTTSEVLVSNSSMTEEKEVAIKPIPLASTVSINLEEGLSYLDSNDLTSARLSLSKALQHGELTESELAQARGVLADLSDRLIFSPEISKDDPYSIEYIIRQGDTLSEIVRDMGVQVDWRFIQRINNISHASSIRSGQNIKLITGPFHAEVDKSAYRLDVYLGEGLDRVFVRSYHVGLGEYNSTPVGSFKVKSNSKLINPRWTNPRNGISFDANDPLNPIGERWIGLEGAEERTKDLSGLGIHGTIEPDTIGKDASMGCIRMHSEDVAEIYEMLAEGFSTVEIYSGN